MKQMPLAADDDVDTVVCSVEEISFPRVRTLEIRAIITKYPALRVTFHEPKAQVTQAIARVTMRELVFGSDS